MQKFFAKRMHEQKFLRNFTLQIPRLKLQLCNIQICVSNVFENVFVLFVVSVHVVFSCIHKLIAFEFQVFVLVVCS